ncbi:hypothetical protein NITGR_440004 [Nitrospina gracilis 3/211]|uniref:Uncharacterized protein n=1 Tax=Nitrospina gracilis (strain 3/211) TaxID=1266370 RepID=M1Z020_NITG3|nr:hypothetical protein NITGR_440004 [Nitrospina gracilis 3/211]
MASSMTVVSCPSCEVMVMRSPEALREKVVTPPSPSVIEASQRLSGEYYHCTILIFQQSNPNKKN